MNNVVVGILVVVVIVLVGWFAYTQGYFTGAQEVEPDGGIQIQLGGSENETPQ